MLKRRNIVKINEFENAAKEEREKLEREQADIAAAEKAREADKAHRGNFNRQAVEALLGNTKLNVDQAREVVTAIAKNLITNISIRY